jgi:hypothetical protein
MSDEIKIIADEKLFEVQVSGKLTKEFYAQFVPAVEKQLAEHGKLHIVFVMHDFHGWTAGAMWEDLKFDLKHWKDIARLALVGETKWQQGMATFCKPFTKATIRYFEQAQLAEARLWAAES